MPLTCPIHGCLVWSTMLQNTCHFISYFLITFTVHLISPFVTELWRIKGGGTPTTTRNVSKKDKHSVYWRCLKTMNLVMGVEKGLTHKPFITELTPVRSLPSVVALMYHKSWTLCERLPTCFTCVRAFTSMCTEMKLQVATFAECLTTHITNIWFLACVDPAMEFQVLLISQWFPTYITYANICSCMRFYV